MANENSGISGVYVQLMAMNKKLGSVESEIRGIRDDLKDHYCTNYEITEKIEDRLRKSSSNYTFRTLAKWIGALVFFSASIYAVITGKSIPPVQ